MVNPVDAPLGRQTVACSVDHPPEIDETHLVHMHVRDACIDPQTLHVLPAHYRPVACMHSDVTAEHWYEMKKPAPK